MKKLTIFVVSILVLNAFDVVAQCNAERLSTACIPKLTEGFNFLKSYKIETGDQGFVEFSYPFMKGTQYMINICSGANPTTTDGIVVNLFDSNRNKVGSSKYNGQLLTAMTYPCNSTGIYYIQYTFSGATNYCGGSALGFKR